MGTSRRDSGRAPADGVLVVDKPAGMTSHDVVAVARRAFGATRVGHTGTLDPLATGVLPLAFGQATRLVRFLGSDTKEYEAVVRFGVTTDTYDVTGTVTGRTDVCPPLERIEAALASLRGEYLQMPPAFSAKKVGGRRAYALARLQQPVTLTPVPVRVTRAELLRMENGAARVAIACSAGFYVRTFAHELGERAGTGAALEALRRTRSGPFTLASAVTLAQVQGDPGGARGALVPAADLVAGMPAVRLTDEGARRVAHGRDVGAPHVLEMEPAAAAAVEGGPETSAGAPVWVRMLAPDGRLLAVGRHAAAALHPAIVLI